MLRVSKFAFAIFALGIRPDTIEVNLDSVFCILITVWLNIVPLTPLVGKCILAQLLIRALGWVFYVQAPSKLASCCEQTEILSTTGLLTWDLL